MSPLLSDDHSGTQLSSTSAAGNDVSSDQVVVSLSLFPQTRHSNLGGSPISPDDLAQLLPSTNGTRHGTNSAGGKPPLDSIQTRGGPQSRAKMFGVIDRYLSETQDVEEAGMEVCDQKELSHVAAFQPDTTESFHPTVSEKGVAIFNAGFHAPSVEYADVRIFSLSLIRHGHKSGASTIVRNSLERHVDIVAKAKRAKYEQCTKKGSSSEEFYIAEQDAYVMISKQQYSKAILVFSKLAQRRRCPTMEVARLLGILSVLYLLVGNQRGSLSCAKSALHRTRSATEQNHCALNLNLLGLVYLGIDQPGKALRTWRETLQTVISALGYDHPYVAVLLNNLGCLHYYAGDCATSLKLFSESLELNQKFLSHFVEGTDAILMDISFTKGNVALILARYGNFDAAMTMLEEVVSLQESTPLQRGKLVVDDTRAMLIRLGARLAAATASTAASTRFFGTGHSIDTLQPILMEESRPPVFGNSDGIPMRRSGTKSPLDAIDASDNLDFVLLGSLATEYSPLQRVRAAVLCWFGKTLQDDERDPNLNCVPFQSAPRKRTSAPVDLDNCSVVDAELYLQEIYDQAVDFLEHDEMEEALELFNSSLESHKDKYGGNHHLVGTAHHNIGMVYLYSERYSQALTFFQEAVTVLGTALGTEHPAVAASLTKMGMIFLVQRNPNGAQETFHRVLKILKKSVGTRHLQVARVLNNIAVAQYDNGALSDASRTLEEARDIQQRLLDMANAQGGTLKSQIRTIELALTNTMSNIGFLHCRQHRHVESLKILTEADRLLRMNGGHCALDIYCLEENISYVKELANDEERRRSLERRNARNPIEMALEVLMDRIGCH